MLVSLNEIISHVKDKIDIELFCCEKRADEKKISSARVNILRLELNGYFEDFPEDPIQIIDAKAIKYFSSIKSSKQDEYLSKIFSYNIPAIVFTDDNIPDERFLNLAKANEIPILKTSASLWGFVQEFERILDELLAPKVDYRGSMLEIFGVGVLITGKSNVGKSECAIDLLQRGHRLIGDDVVEVTARAGRVLIAKGKFPIAHRLELRGIGIVDVIELFGISAVKDVEKIQLVVKLEKWESDKNYERLGLDEKKIDIMGLSVPFIEIPVAPGRNIALLIEVAAMNFRLRKRGIVPAEELEKELLQSYEKEKTDNEENI